MSSVLLKVVPSFASREVRLRDSLMAAVENAHYPSAFALA
jgi:hypothetical protein